MIHPLLSAAAKGIVEGFTEFLPISSTGHLILVRDFFPLTADPSRVQELDNLFDVMIQLPAVLAIVILYWSRLWAPTSQILKNPNDKSAQKFWLNIFVAFLPAGIIGFLFKDFIDQLMNPLVVALALIVGGVILIWIEHHAKGTKNSVVARAEEVSFHQAWLIGLIQCLSMIPGTSRSGATIVGGRFLGLSRVAAAEFSFFLAIPTMVGAFTLKFYKALHLIQWKEDGLLFLVGGLSAFLSAWVVVSFFIRFIQKHSLAIFGWYRIALGLIVLVTLVAPAALRSVS